MGNSASQKLCIYNDHLESIASYLEPHDRRIFGMVSRRAMLAISKFSVTNYSTTRYEMQIHYPFYPFKRPLSTASILQYMIVSKKPVSEIKAMFPYGRYLSGHSSRVTSYEMSILISNLCHEYFADMTPKQVKGCCYSHWIRSSHICYCLIQMDVMNLVETSLYRGVRAYYNNNESITNYGIIGFLSAGSIPTDYINHLVDNDPQARKGFHNEDNGNNHDSIPYLTGRILGGHPISSETRKKLKQFWSLYYCAYTGDTEGVTSTRALERLAKNTPVEGIKKMIEANKKLKSKFLRYYIRKGYLHRYITVSAL